MKTLYYGHSGSYFSPNKNFYIPIMECRDQCGACCIAPSINRPYFGMPDGKPAGQACVHLEPESMRCRIWATENYPETCKHFAPSFDVCGNTREEAIRIITELELATK